jgi:hypothetical protein
VIRKAALLALGVVALGATVPALADTTSSDTRDKGVCVALGTGNNGGGRDGVCLWIPTN